MFDFIGGGGGVTGPPISTPVNGEEVTEVTTPIELYDKSYYIALCFPLTGLLYYKITFFSKTIV